MNKVYENDLCVVYDDVLPKEQFNMIWKFCQQLQYSIPHFSGWTKVWRQNDGHNMGSQMFEHSKLPFNSPIDAVFQIFTETSKQHPDIVSSWNEMAVRNYIYPSGTKLNWHNDPGYQAAGIYYTHPYWASTWGGELMIAQTPPCDKIPDPCLDHTFEDAFLEHHGMGMYITAKPNRLVFTKGGVWHSINRVDKDAGDHVRSAMVAFFTNCENKCD
jgi:hypothetical protein